MRRLLRQRGMMLGMMVLGLVPIAALSASSPRIYYPQAVESGAGPALKAQITRGRYLVKLSDCLACHTAHGNGPQGEPFAGGFPIKTPFGAIYASNITPDKATGIGSWTFKQFDQAVRYGVSPHGFLFAAMPFNYYDKMSRQQSLDMWEYLRRVPAVNRKNKALGMPAPFSWRWMQFGWRFLFFNPTGPLKPNPERSAEWNRGRFIVEGPGHCGACHTPHNFLGAAEHQHFLQGSSISGMWAPNITSLATWPVSIQTVMQVFSDSRGLGGGELRGPMLDAIDHSLKFMTPADMRAVAVYLRTVSSKRASGPGPVPMKEVDLALGEQTFKTHCAACHSSGAGGAPIVGNAKDWRALSRMPLYILYENTWYGVGIMPAKGGCKDCSSRTITSAIAYMLKHSQPGAEGKGPQAAGSPSASAAGGAGSPGKVVSLTVGERVFKTSCAACHATGVAGAPRYGNHADWAPRLKQGLSPLYKNTLHGIGAMPPKGGCAGCDVDQIKSAVDYLVAGSGGKAMVKSSLKSN